MISPTVTVDIVCALSLYTLPGLSIMEHVHFMWKHLYTMPVVSVALCFGLKEINTGLKYTFPPSGNQLGIYWKLLNPAD